MTVFFFRNHNNHILSEAERQANIVKQQTEQQLSAKAQELQNQALLQAHILKEKESSLKNQEQIIQEQMRKVEEQKKKEMELSAREAELFRQAQLFKEEAEKQKLALEAATATAMQKYQKEEEKLEMVTFYLEGSAYLFRKIEPGNNSCTICLKKKKKS